MLKTDECAASGRIQRRAAVKIARKLIASREVGYGLDLLVGAKAVEK